MGARSKAGERVSDCLPDRLQYREPCLPNAFGRKARVYQLRVKFSGKHVADQSPESERAGCIHGK